MLLNRRPAAPGERPLNSPGQVLFASLVGTAIEFFDFYIYATAAVLVFPHLFFPSTDPAAATLASLATFAIAFVARPIGSALFGHFGDRIGRKATLVAALLTMGVSTVVIGFKLERNGDVAAQDVRDRVSTLVPRLPYGTDPPVVEKFNLDAAPVVTVVVSGGSGRKLREVTEIAKKQMHGFGGMISVDVGTRERAERVIARLRVFTLAESLGGVESLVCHPATMTHASVPQDRRDAIGIGDGLVRFSVGVEDAGDLLEDLHGAFAAL